MYTFILHKYEYKVIIKIIQKFQENCQKLLGHSSPEHTRGGERSAISWQQSYKTATRRDYYGNFRYFVFHAGVLPNGYNFRSFVSWFNWI